jgi:alpha-amylase/alpha-mannosidase (GH57 family)
MPTALVIHGHFYQPPRENPWTGVIDDQPSAQPFPNWNDRVYYECYRPNAFARVFDLKSGRIEGIINNYESISFNFGPTLLSWMEKYHPGTYDKILESDGKSAKKNGGHGNAIAQGFNHTILPLCNEADRITQVKWGIEDFKRRFKREPESLWLPETACNDATLSVLIDHKLKYVILSPEQAERVRPMDGADWTDVSSNRIDPGMPYRYFHRDGSKRFIDIFFYDMGIARGIAFEGSLISSQALIDRIGRVGRAEGRIVQTATDGESYGHHTKFGDRSLAYALKVEAAQGGYWVTNYGAYLEKHPPTWEVEIKKGPDGNGTSWSCAHGVGRWYRDCGCQTGGKEGWNQAWRGPLRKAFDFLRDRVHGYFDQERGKLFMDPWVARNDYIQLVLDPEASRKEFLKKHAGRELSEMEQVKALTHLEIQRNAMLMYTSCGWFFTEISGIETVQVMKYAARIFDLLETLGFESPETQFLDILSEAKSNIPEFGTGADVYRRFAEPTRVTPQGVVAHLAISSLVNHVTDNGEAGGYLFEMLDTRKEEHGRFTLMTGHVLLQEAMTRQHFRYAFAGLHLGGIDFYGAIRPFMRQENFDKSAQHLWDQFYLVSLPKLLRLMQEEFGPEEFGVEQLLPESRQKIFKEVFGSLVERFSEQYVRLYEDNRRNLEMLQSVGFELPREIRAAAEFTFGKLFEEEIQRREWFKDPDAYRNLISLADEVTRHGYRIDRFVAEHTFRNLITEIVEMAVEKPTEENVRAAIAVVQLTKKLGLEYNLYLAQEAVFAAAGKSLQFEKLVELSEMLDLKTDYLLDENDKLRKSLHTDDIEVA